MKISSSQIFWLLLTMSPGMVLLLTIGPAILYAKQDAWMSMLWSGGFGVLVAYVAVRVSLLYPGMTFIEYSQVIFGKWIGRLVAIPYLFTCYCFMAVILREFADFMHTSLFYETPLWATMLVMLLAMMYVTHRGGIEGIARCAELLGILILLTIIAGISLSVNNWDYHRLFPLYMNSAFARVVSGGMPATAFFGEPAIMIMMFVGFLNKRKKVISSALWPCIFMALASAFVATNIVAEFGPNLSGRMMYPVYMAVQYISVMDFIQNIDVIVDISWIVSIFVKLSIYMFITSYGTAEWLKVSNWQRLIAPIAIVTLVAAMLPRNVASTGVTFVAFAVHYVVPIVMIATPLLLWIGALARGRTTPASSLQ